MTVPTAQELTRLRTRPHRTRLHLSVYQPNTVLAAQINMPAIARGERVIEVDILGGYHPAVVRGQTCYIGTTPGGRDVGRLRAISALADSITVAENDETLRDGMYLTVAEYFEPWAVFPRIVLDENNVPTFYKDYDILYTDQNEQMDPVICMGPSHAVFLEMTPSGSFANIWYTSSGTYDPSDDSVPASGYAWTFEGAIQTGSSLPDPGYRTYTGAGHFLTSLEVTSNFAKVFTGRRHVSVYTRPEEGPAMPIVSWGLASFDGSRDQGGYSLRFWVRENVDYSKIVEGGLVVVFSDDNEGSFEGKAGGNAEKRSSIVYVGYIEDDSISLNPITNRLEFRSSSITGVMKRLASFSATLEIKEDALTWNEMTNMVVDKAMVHYMRWHSTIMAIADFSPTGNDTPVEFMDFERTSVYDAVNNLYGSSLLATAVSDRQGKIWAEIEANVRPTGTERNLDTTLSLTRQDWRSEIGIEVRRDEVLSYLELGGLAYSGVATGTTEAFLSGAPGEAPAYFGSLERLSGMVIEGQTHLNELSGLAFASRNANYPEVTLPMAGDYRIVDIAPQERLLVSLNVDDTYRRISWDEKAFVPHEIAYQYEAADQMLLMDLTVGEETYGPPGETVIIPVTPPFPDPIGPEIELPEFPIPPEIPIPPIDPPPGTGDVVYVITNGYITRTRNFFEANTVWEEVLDNSQFSGTFQNFKLDNIDPANVAWTITRDSNLSFPWHAYRITNLNSDNPTVTCVMTGIEWYNIQPVPKNPQSTMYDIATSVVDGSIYILGHRQSLGTPSVGIARNIGAGWEHKFIGENWSVQDGSTIIWPSPYSANRIFSTFRRNLFRSLDKGGYWVNITPADAAMEDLHIPYQGNSGDYAIYLGHDNSTEKELWYSENGGLTFTDISPDYIGYKWAPGRSGYYWRSVLASAHANRNILLFALRPNKSELAGDWDAKLFVSTSGPGGLVPVYDTGACWSVHINKSNSSKMYAMTYSAILGSQNLGTSWINEVNSWNRDISVTYGAGLGVPRAVLPVWTL